MTVRVSRTRDQQFCGKSPREQLEADVPLRRAGGDHGSAALPARRPLTGGWSP
jgi:hypothetical protein